ncbi:septal ring lytic transglycosylase RlpA family protein [Pyxidicoccus fallax]|uniref:Probable endolytic peptidoglycan transglycosylase RlpA n=1 Tax=Pyxidicoccus fallax TaxID=394095 RepID=A0A848LTK7_9BACT|nr:septal ring lytic transglycosylase RlpA family protein [Pyxidicoccus fallax]NMO20960.1 septal ring lytic transglycosylase RlpA family protein [Pyxidicoccus fallax]NPC82076.1 septal ring lytic transglycosylase RlpA family protein [Pyxidicoccus fallax]
MRGSLVACVVGLSVLAGCAQRAAKPQPPETPAATRQAPKSQGSPPVTRREQMPRGYLGEGLASFYGPGLHGRPTASGERFNQNALTAAHRKERFGSCVRVVNMENGKQVEVRVNDRGPFVEGRIIDLSLAAAKKLDMVDKGVTRVRLYRCTTPVSEIPRASWAAPV